eukprot:6354796-Prorocentrum_lima.AAC.1
MQNLHWRGWRDPDAVAAGRVRSGWVRGVLGVGGKCFGCAQVVPGDRCDRAAGTERVRTKTL